MKFGGGGGGLLLSSKELIVFTTSFCTLFALQDFDKIAAFFKANYKVELTEKDMCVKGWNWGTAKFSGEFPWLWD